MYFHAFGGGRRTKAFQCISGRGKEFIISVFYGLAFSDSSFIRLHSERSFPLCSANMGELTIATQQKRFILIEWNVFAFARKLFSIRGKTHQRTHVILLQPNNLFRESHRSMELDWTKMLKLKNISFSSLSHHLRHCDTSTFCGSFNGNSISSAAE